jgi:hypothetical protein
MLKSRVPLALAVVMSAALMVLGIGNRSGLMGAPSSPHSVVGSWIFIPTGPPGRAPGTPSLVTFTSDGNVVWAGPSGSSSGGHGGWIGTGDRTVTETFVFSRHPAGEFIGTQKVRLKLTLNATFDEINGAGKTDLFDAAGAVVQSADITTHATRINVESPDVP